MAAAAHTLSLHTHSVDGMVDIDLGNPEERDALLAAQHFIK